MNTHSTKGPQHTLMFRVVAFISRLRLRYLHTRSAYRELITALYLFTAGITALSTITVMAYLTDLMLLFPPLGPSAFILFYTPLSESASPRNLVMGHCLALLSGMGALFVAKALFPEFNAAAPMVMNWSRVTAVALAMGGASLIMCAARCVHPPAVATALIAAMGYLDNLVQVGGVVAAVIFLALEAYLFNRIFGGLPYPIWRAKPEVDKLYRSLTGSTTAETSRWQKLAERTFQRR